MQQLLDDAARRAIRYLQGLGQRGVAPAEEAVARLAELDEALPSHPRPASETLRLLDEIGSPVHHGERGRALLRLRHRRRAAGGAGGNWLATAWDQNARSARRRRPRQLSSESPCAGCWICSICRPTRRALSSPAPRWRTSPRSPPLAMRVLSRVGWNVEAEGLFGAPPITVVDRRGGASDADEVARDARARPRARRARAGRRAGPHASGGACRGSTARRSSACRRATSTPARSIRSRHVIDARTCGRRVGACRWRVRPVGRREPRRSRHLRDGLRARRFVGDRRAQVAQRALRQRPRVRARRDALRAAMAITADYLPTASEQREPVGFHARSCPAGRAAWKSGRRCGRWDAAGSPR